MNAADVDRIRREILSDMGPLLHDELVAGAWGRALVEVVRTPSGEPAVAGIDIEEITGDEKQVDAAFAGSAVQALLPILAKTTEALCALDGVELDDVRGGTFVRLEQGFAWLPGLVRTPSPLLDRERGMVLARMRQKNDTLRARFGADQVELDIETLRLRWLGQARALGSACATPLGTFARSPRTWGWAWSNPSLPYPAQKASAAITDALEERDLWEISTPTFATDEATAWALAAFLCDRSGADGVHRVARDDGALFVLLHNAQEC